MPTAIVVTNFSQSSRNALEYTCAFLGHTSIKILLLNIFSFPAPLASDAISIAAISETLADDERLLQEEFEWVRENYPGVNIEAEMVTGNFMEELRDIASNKDVALVVLGAGGKYNDLLSWDANIINAFVDLTVPTLIIPSQIKFQPIKRVAFACNYFRKNLYTPVALIKRLIEFTKAKLFVINVVDPREVLSNDAQRNKEALQESLKDIDPVYYEPSFSKVIPAIDNFTAEENIDLMIAIPTRHGIWYSIFRERHTRGLVYLNHIPIMGLSQEGTFI